MGGGFGGLNCARALGKRRDLSITLIDRRNYHLFQPLLYQVAMAGLSPGDIASPIRGLFSSKSNVHVVQGEVEAVHTDARRVVGTAGVFVFLTVSGLFLPSDPASPRPRTQATR